MNMTEDMTVKELTELVMQQAKAKGFGTKPSEIDVAEKIALIHSEISEAYEAYRHKKIDGKDGFKEELGDAVQRILHLCGIFDIDIETEILKKMEKNKGRKWIWKKMNEGRR
jgi:NTP pyrophosphatase (non-canonical NTP hydrolase)